MRTLWLLALGVPAWGCSCGYWPSVKEAWAGSPLVFVGVVEKTEPSTASGPRYVYGKQRAEVRVEEPFKGVTAGQVVRLQQAAHDCAPKFRDGARYLFYLRAIEGEGAYEAPSCHRSRAIGDAAEDLLFLRGLPGTAKGTRLSGTVSLHEDTPEESFRKVRDVAGVRVKISGVGEPRTVMTNGDGVYEVYGLPAGNYRVEAEAPPGMKVRFPVVTGVMRQEAELVALKEDAAVSVGFVLEPASEVAGRVFDPDGRPMKGVCVNLVAERAGMASNSRTSDCTEEDGAYVLKGMGAGRYRVVANRDGVKTAKEPFGRMYAPGTEKESEAAVIEIGYGDRVRDFDIRVPRVEKRRTVRGRLLYADGRAAPDQSVQLKVEGGEMVYGRTDRDGRFEMKMLAGQRAEAWSELMVSRAQAAKCPQFGAVFRPQGWGAILETAKVTVPAEGGGEEVALVFPFASCAEYPEPKESQQSGGQRR